jgi:REP element-mobilizing transposase RayT
LLSNLNNLCLCQPAASLGPERIRRINAVRYFRFVQPIVSIAMLNNGKMIEQPLCHLRTQTWTYYAQQIQYYMPPARKNGRSCLKGSIQTDTVGVKKDTCVFVQGKAVETVESGGKDHVHLFVSVPPYLSLSKMMQYLKGSHKLLTEFAHLRRHFWGRHL